MIKKLSEAAKKAIEEMLKQSLSSAEVGQGLRRLKADRIRNGQKGNMLNQICEVYTCILQTLMQ